MSHSGKDSCSVVKHWNGIKETNTATGSDNDQKKQKLLEPVYLFIAISSMFSATGHQIKTAKYRRPNYRTCSYKRTVKQFSNLKDYNQCTFIYFFMKKTYVVGTHLNSNEYPQHMIL